MNDWEDWQRDQDEAQRAAERVIEGFHRDLAAGRMTSTEHAAAIQNVLDGLMSRQAEITRAHHTTASDNTRAASGCLSILLVGVSLARLVSLVHGVTPETP